MADFEAVIGLEIHVQLATKTKMFCSCELSFGAEPNIHTCPVCLGHPGTLPVSNEQAIRFGIETALALGCEIAPRSIFHRKNYFYPDLSKGYQISQYDIPLGSSGRLGEVRIHRAHLEEDAAKLSHLGESGRIDGSDASLVDFNRGGTPLIEIVTEPDIRDAAIAREWLQLLRSTLRQLGVSDCNMEEGSLRCDANISIRRRGEPELGVKTELKNMNSFRFIERGIEAEIARQIELVEAGGRVDQATMHFDPASGSLTVLRSKEFAHDHRYFPEPDLVPLAPSLELIAEIRAALPELPETRIERYIGELGIPGDAARVLGFDAAAAEFFEAALALGGASPSALSGWVTGELAAALREAGHAGVGDSALSSSGLAALAGLVEAKTINRRTGREILVRLVSQGGDPVAIVEAEGLGSVSDADALSEIVDRALAAQPKAADQVAAGNQKAVGPIVGFVMRETKGRADGPEVTRLIRAKLGLD